MRLAVAAIAVGALVASLGGVTADAAPSADPPRITELSWSPNGKWLAFLVDERASGSSTSLSVVRLDRAVQRRVVRLTSPGAALYGIAWSPDSRRLAVRSYDLAGDTRTLISGANGLDLRQLDGRLDDWAPDSRRLALCRSGSLYVVDSRSGVSRLLVQGCGARWSPNGARIAFSRTTSRSQTRIFSVDSSGGDLRQLGAEPAMAAQQNLVGWSRDSTRIAYYEGRPFDGFTQAYVAPADGSPQATAIAQAAYLVLWSPGGRRLAVRDFAKAGVSIVSPDGATMASIPDAEQDFAWGPGGGSLVFTGKDGVYAVRTTSPNLPARVAPGSLPAWSKLGWIAVAHRGSCAGGGERVFVVRPNGKRFHALSRCRPTS